jgi:hypothetical protein
MPTFLGRHYTRDELEARLGDLSQVAGVSVVTFSDGTARGVRALLFKTGSGLEFWVLVDRAFDIAKCQFRGIELGWQSPVGVRAPWFHEVNDERGASFLRSFSGFLVTCGLDHTGAPYHDTANRYFAADRTGIDQPLHGRISATPGELVAYGHEWRGDHCMLFCEGIVRQVAVFGEHLVLTRRYETELGSSSFVVRDHVRNHSFFLTPHMLLYHINLGFPLLDNGAELILPTQGIRWAFRDATSEGIGYRFQQGPRRDCGEQVYVHKVREDADGNVRAALINRNLADHELGLAVEFNVKQLPYLIQWQNFQAGSYSVAIEPSTCHALGRPHAEANGELAWLNHGEERVYELRISILSGPNEISRFENAVRQIVPDILDSAARPDEMCGMTNP